MTKHTHPGIAACLAIVVVMGGCTPKAPAPAPPLTFAVTPLPGTLGMGGTYAITVTNRSASEGTNIVLTATLPDGQTLFRADGPTKATVAGKVVKFAPLAKLASKARARYVVTFKGAAGGHERFEVSLTSDQMTAHIRR